MLVAFEFSLALVGFLNDKRLISNFSRNAHVSEGAKQRGVPKARRCGFLVE